MKLNKYILSLMLATSAFSFTGCSDFLDRSPLGQFTEDDTPEGGSAIDGQVFSIYTLMRSYNITAGIPAFMSSKDLGMNEELTATVTVTNTGTRDGLEVVQLYIRDLVGSVTRPVKELKGFQKIFLKAGESKEVTFKITPELLKFYDYDLNYVCEPGDFNLMIGGNSCDVKNASFTLKM